MKRRTLLLSSSAMAFARMQGEAPSPAASLVDCQLYIGDHPRRDLPQFTSSSWAALGLKQGWLGHFGAFLRGADHLALNRELHQRCEALPGAVASVSLDPTQKSWPRDFEQSLPKTKGCKPLLRLCPSLHGYDWQHPGLMQLLDRCSQSAVPVQIITKFEDARTQLPQVPLPPLPLKGLQDLCQRLPNLRLMLLNLGATDVQLSLRGLGRNLWVDSAMIEGAAGLAGLLGHWPSERLCLGSYAPFFYAAALPLKLQEAGLRQQTHEAVAHNNARAFLG